MADFLTQKEINELLLDGDKEINNTDEDLSEIIIHNLNNKEIETEKIDLEITGFNKDKLQELLIFLFRAKCSKVEVINEY